MPQMTHASSGTSDSPQPILTGGTVSEGSAPTPPSTTPGATLPQVESLSYTDIGLRWAKELVAALIAISLIVCLVVMLWKAFNFLERDQADLSFQRVKDLLLFINPLVGVVIGYYFNRVSTEARAENAERTAHEATTTAQQAQAGRGQAEVQAQTYKAEANESKAVLQDFIPAAQTILSQMTPPPLAALSGVGGGVDPLAEARINLQRSLERARAIVIERRGL